jgi:hypothetical protein
MVLSLKESYCNYSLIYIQKIEVFNLCIKLFANSSYGTTNLQRS